MSEHTDGRRHLEPGPDHPITVTPTDGEVVVTRAGASGEQVVARSAAALTLQEADYPPVQYLPLADVDPALLEASDHTTYCPYKGEAGYYSLVVDGRRAEDAVWTYRTPYDAVSPIADHVAFYPDQVRIEIS